MSDLTTSPATTEKSPATTENTVTGTQPTLGSGQVSGQVSQPPVLVTEQQVLFSTAGAALPRPRPMIHRLTDALAIVAAALRPPPPRRHYAQRAWYIENAAMSREMDRL